MASLEQFDRKGPVMGSRDAMRRQMPWVELTLLVMVLLVARFAIVGADLMWVVALGDAIRDGYPSQGGLPFAAQPTPGWPNPVVVSEVGLSLVYGLGDWTLVAGQVVIVTVVLVAITVEGRRLGGSDRRIMLVLVLLVIAAAAPLVIARLPSLSLAPFMVLAILLRRQGTCPPWTIWLAPALLAVWGNLHGGVLVGLCLMGVYVVLARPRLSLAHQILLVLVSLTALICTSAGLRTVDYYVGVLTSEAARQRVALWSAPSLGNPLDVAMMLAVLGLIALWVRGRPPAWEWVAVAGMLAATLSGARHGVWLALFLALGAARTRREQADPHTSVPPPRAAGIALSIVGALAMGGMLVSRGPAVGPPGNEAVPAIRQIADGRAVLAVEPLAETLAQQGVQVWAANPLDAFDHSTQAAFLEFLHEGTVPSVDGFDVVVIESGSPVPQGWEVVAGPADYLVLVPQR